MKKVIVVEILLLFIFVVSIANAVEFFVVYNETISDIWHHVDGTSFWIKYPVQGVSALITFGCFSIISAVADLAAIIIIAIKDFPCFKPLIEKLKAHKEQRAAVKAEQASVAKQQRIEQLQAELDELKKDE